MSEYIGCLQRIIDALDCGEDAPDLRRMLDAARSRRNALAQRLAERNGS